MYPNQSGCHFYVGSVSQYGKIHNEKNSFYKKIRISLLLVLHRHIQVLNFIQYKQCQAAMCHGSFQEIWQLTQCPVSSCLSASSCCSICFPCWETKQAQKLLLCCCCQALFQPYQFHSLMSCVTTQTSMPQQGRGHCSDGSEQPGLLRQCCSTMAETLRYSRGATCCTVSIAQHWVACGIFHVSLPRQEVLQKMLKLQKEALLYLPASLLVITVLL